MKIVKVFFLFDLLGSDIWNRVLCSLVWSRTSYIAKAGQELLIILPLPWRCWGYKFVKQRSAQYIKFYNEITFLDIYYIILWYKIACIFKLKTIFKPDLIQNI